MPTCGENRARESAARKYKRYCRVATIISPNARFFFGRKNFRQVASDFVVGNSRRFGPIFGAIDLEVGKKCRSFPLKKTEDSNRAPSDLEFGAFARTQLEHRPPGAGVAGDDDFR